jgi:hypothetical protein
MGSWSLTEADGSGRLSLEGGRSLALSGRADAAFEQGLVRLIESSDKVRYSTFSVRDTGLGTIERSILRAPAGKDFKLFYGSTGIDKKDPDGWISPEAYANPRAHIYRPDGDNQPGGTVQHGDASYRLRGGSYFHDKLALFSNGAQKVALVLTANATETG